MKKAVVLLLIVVTGVAFADSENQALDESNLVSQRVAEAVFQMDCESIIDTASKRPAYRYTAYFNTLDGR